MKKRTIIATIAGLGVATTLLAGCGPKHCERGEMGPRAHCEQSQMGPQRGEMRMMKEVFAKLDLTSAQRDQLKDIMEDTREKMRDKREKKDMPDASEFMSKDSFDKAAFIASHKKMQDKMVQNREEMLNQRAETFEKIFNILTPEQREKLITLSKERKED